jgi:hypothetical protein
MVSVCSQVQEYSISASFLIQILKLTFIIIWVVIILILIYEGFQWKGENIKENKMMEEEKYLI